MRFRLAAVALAALIAASCGAKTDRKPVHPARGRVVDAAGKPVAGATVVFHPAAKLDDAAHKPAGTTDKDGRFALTTYTTDDGAPAGEYVVTVELRPAPKGPGETTPDTLKGKFASPKASQFKQTVLAGDNDLPPIKLPWPEVGG